MTAFLLFPIAVADATTESRIPHLIWSIVLGIIFLVFILVASICGHMVGAELEKMAQFRSSYQINKQEDKELALQQFISDMRIIILLLDVQLIIAVITLILYEVLDGNSDKWVYVMVHMIWRLLESSISSSILIFIYRQTLHYKKNKQPSETSSSLELSRKVTLPNIEVLASNGHTHNGNNNVQNHNNDNNDNHNNNNSDTTQDNNNENNNDNKDGTDTINVIAVLNKFEV